MEMAPWIVEHRVEAENDEEEELWLEVLKGVQRHLHLAQGIKQASMSNYASIK